MLRMSLLVFSVIAILVACSSSDGGGKKETGAHAQLNVERVERAGIQP